MMTPREYSEETKREAVTLVRKGVGVQQAADQFGVPNETLRQWVREAGVPTPSTEPVDPAIHQAVLERNDQLERENEMLAHAVIYFAKRMQP
jgi:transposase-like protein